MRLRTGEMGPAGPSTLSMVRVVVGHRLREGVLLPPVEKEHVERLLDFLLPLDGEHLPFLGGHGGKPRLCLLLAAARVVALHVDPHNHVVHRTDDTLPQGVYAVVKLLHHGVALAAVGYQLVALQLQGVVLVYLPLHGGVADARPRGDEVTAFVGSVRYSLMNRASFSWVSCSSASAL